MVVRAIKGWVVIAGIGAGTLALAETEMLLGDPHLDVVPRTEDEAARVQAVTAWPTDFTVAQPFEDLPAGTATVDRRADHNAFSQPSANITFENELDFKVGNALFRQIWEPVPSENGAADGLGPLFNARSCEQCHLKDGRGHPPRGVHDSAVSMFLRVSVPGPPGHAVAGIKDYIATLPEPTYGTQLQDYGVAGHAGEARLRVTYAERRVMLADGTEVTLRDPTYEAVDLAYGPLHPGAMLSPRVAPQMIGLGLLEAIPAADILALADPDDADGDGVSGRANVVWSAEFDQPMLGRFGLKAGLPTITQQTAEAFASDIGISTPLRPAGAGECTPRQGACLSAVHGDGDARETEVDAIGLELVSFYSRNLGVPARDGADDPVVLHGKRVFHETGCAACHQPSFVTHRLQGQPAQNFQLIWPYTDLLLHDMGPGLADNRPEARATGREWRTPPLWGIGLTAQVSGHTYFLHDGRARSLLEAVLWHGGEAQAARDKVVGLQAKDREALIAFLESL